MKILVHLKIQTKKCLIVDGPIAGGDKHGFDHTFCINPVEESGNLR